MIAILLAIVTIAAITFIITHGLKVRFKRYSFKNIKYKILVLGRQTSKWSFLTINKVKRKQSSAPCTITCLAAVCFMAFCQKGGRGQIKIKSYLHSLIKA